MTGILLRRGDFNTDTVEMPRDDTNGRKAGGQRQRLEVQQRAMATEDAGCPSS